MINLVKHDAAITLGKLKICLFQTRAYITDYTCMYSLLRDGLYELNHCIIIVF